MQKFQIFLFSLFLSLGLSAQDVTPPTAKCQDIVVHLDVNGQVQISPADIDAGSSDDLTQSSALTMSLSPNSFGLSAVWKQLEWKPLGQQGIPLIADPYSNAINQSLAIAPDGTPYVSQSLSSKNNVLKWDGNAWQELPFTTQSLSYGHSQTLAIAPNGTPYLAYGDYYGAQKLRVLEWTGSTWQQVGTPNLSTNYPEQMKFAIAADGTLYLGYVETNYNPYSVSFHLLKWTGSTWLAIGGPVTFPDYVSDLSLVIAPNGMPYISGYDHLSGSIFVKKWTASTWQTISGVIQGTNPHLAIASDGTPYLIHTNNSAQITVIKYDGTSWQSLNFSGTNTTLGTGFLPRIAIAPDGTPYISYQDSYAAWKTSILKWDDNDWQLLGRKGEGRASYSLGAYSGEPYPNLAVAPDGSIYTAYQDDEYGKTTVLKWIDDNYTTLTVTDAAGNSSSCLAWVNVKPNPTPVAKCQDITVELDLAGQVTIAPSEVDGGSYDDETPSLSLSLSAFDLSAVGKQPAWQSIGGPAPTTRARVKPQLVTAPDGTFYFSYVEINYATYPEQSSIFVLKDDGNGWQTLGVTGASMAASNSFIYYSLAVAPDGTPYIAYRNEDVFSRTSVIKWDGSDWQAVHEYQTTIYSANSTSRQKITFAPDGTPYLYFWEKGYYSSSQSFSLYRWVDGKWRSMLSYPRILSNEVYGLDFAPDGTPYISYRKNEGYRSYMTLAKWNGFEWEEIAGSDIELSEHRHKFIFAPDGTPYFFYVEKTGYYSYNSTYKSTVLRWDGNSWQALGGQGLFPNSLFYDRDFAISPNGTPMITYVELGSFNSPKTHVLKWNENTWQSIGNTLPAAYEKLMIDPNGIPHVYDIKAVHKWDGDNYTTLTASDALGQSSQCRAWVIVEEASCIPPAALASQGCNNCGEIRYNICQGDPAPTDLGAYIMANSNYESGASLLWYADNNGTQGSLLASAPAVNTAQIATDWYWVAQEVETDCPGPATRMQVRVKRLFTPDFSLPAIGCGGTGQVDLAAYVSDPRNKATAYTFYSVDPQANTGATPVGTATATHGVVNFGQHVIVTLSSGTQTYWVQSTVPNGCGGVTSSTLNAPAQSASLNFIPNQTVNCGDPVNIAFSGQHTSHFIWHDLASYNNPHIGITGAFGMGNLTFTATNTSGNPLTATIRVIPYNGNCAGQAQNFDITVQPGTNCRQAEGNSLQLAARRINEHDVALDWNVRYDADLIRFEVEKKRNNGEFEAIGYKDWQGNGAYQYMDMSGMGNTNAYRLKLVHTDGRIVWSEIVKVNMDFFQNHRFSLYPNPTSGRFQVKALFPMEASYNWQLSDAMGKTLMQGKMQAEEMSIQIEALAAGVYHLVMISPEGKRYLMKVVKQ